MDAANPVIQLCAAGMAAEGAGRADEAKGLFMRAWDASRDDYEACIAAHYVARHQDTLELELHWNEEALRRASAAGDARVREFYASLHLNLASSLERAGRIEDARGEYALAAERLNDLPPGPYANLVRSGVEAGRARVGYSGERQ